MSEFFYFDKKEIIEILLAIFILTFIFSFDGIKFNPALLSISFLGVGLSFLVHELAHKYAAIKLGYHARFRIYLPSSLLSIILAFTGVKLAAPGWVEIHPYKFKDWLYRRLKYSVEEMGKIALVGPLSNIILSFIFLLAGIDFLKFINAWIALFNLLPIPPLDGSKVLHWSIGGWAFFFILSIILLIV
jgi:Zn-dependent protease